MSAENTRTMPAMLYYHLMASLITARSDSGQESDFAADSESQSETHAIEYMQVLAMPCCLCSVSLPLHFVVVRYEVYVPPLGCGLGHLEATHC